MDSIFPEPYSLRNDWTAYLLRPTPYELVGDMWLKREDKFAPLGYGGINGSKLRQCIYLLGKYKLRKGVISGSSVRSPQIAMSAIVAKHFHMPSVQIVGATKPTTAILHENVAIGAAAGAEFIINKVAYNPAIQKKVADVAKFYARWYRLEYGISLPKTATDKEIIGFHAVGARQVEGFPEDAENLIVPVGSANSVISVIYGLHKYPPKNLKKLIFMLIGPSKIKFMNERLDILGARGVLSKYAGEIIDLFGTKYATYEDEFSYVYHGIEMHPTYEAKCFKYLEANRPEFFAPDTCFWVIGSKPYLKNMQQYLRPVPASLPLHIYHT